MKTKCVALLAAVFFAGAVSATPIEIFGSTTGTLLRGTFPGDFPGQFYGGSIAGGFPVVLSDAQARAAVLGAPDGQFLSLPGGPGISGTAFQGAYVEIAFGINFGPDTLLNIWEIGNSGERAQLFLWTNNGGNIQPTITTNGGAVTLDLSVYAGVLASLGATSFTRVGIGGLDQLGASRGFDLDAVSIITAPEPTMLMLFGLGLLGLGLMRRRSHS